MLTRRLYRKKAPGDKYIMSTPTHNCPFFASVVDLNLHYNEKDEINATFLEALQDTLTKAFTAVKAETDRQDKEHTFQPIRIRFRSSVVNGGDSDDEGTLLYIAIGPGVRDLNLIEHHSGEHRCYKRDTSGDIAQGQSSGR